MACPSKKNSNKPLNMKLVSIMSALLVSCSVGSIAGTYSWYEYNARASLNYHGTAVGETAGMKIGLFSDVNLKDAQQHNLIADRLAPNLYWTINNSLDSDTVSYYCEMNKYAVNYLQPTTSGYYEENGEFSLKTAPIAYKNYTPVSYSNRLRYIYIPIVFKIDNATPENVNDFRVVLSNVEVEGEGLIQNGLRIYFKNQDGNFIFNPTHFASGKDIVGGGLDLDSNGYFDAQINAKTGKLEQYFYGEADQIVLKEEKEIGTDPIPYDERTTFNGGFKKDTYAIDFEQTHPKTSSYLGINDVIGKKTLGVVNPYYNLILVETTIYAEGWSPFVSFSGNLEAKNFFNLKLDFEPWSA